MLELLERFDWSGSWAEPLFIFYAGEEGDYDENGLEDVFREFPWTLEADLAFCPEPTENRLELGCVGTAQVEVTFRGRAVHSARPWLGENALTKAGAFLAGLHERAPEDHTIDGLTFREVLTPVRAQGGVASNVVPDVFRVTVNYRFAPGKEREDVVRTFEGLLDGLAEFEVRDFAPSGPVSRDNPLLQRFVARANPEVRPKQAWTDVARFAVHGVDAANFGPGIPEQAHQREEHARLSLLEECYAMFAGYLNE
jgi:succinyl-diaminopimelate desuccinylase